MPATRVHDPLLDKNSLSLAIGEHQLRPLLGPGDGLVGIDHRPRRSSDCERLELFGNLPLSPVEAGEEDAAAALKVIVDSGAVFELEAQPVSTSSAGTSSNDWVSGISSSAGSPQCPSSIASVSA